MAPDFHQGMQLNMQQRLEMVMTPQMIQSMEMLQLPIMQLEQRIQQELLENPALELMEMREEPAESDNGSDYEDTEYSADESPDESNIDIVDADPGYDYEDLHNADEIDYDWNNDYGEAEPFRRYQGDEDEEYDLIANAEAPPLSFTDFLEQQLTYFELTEREKKTCRQIIYNLDNAGYLSMPLAETIDPEDPSPPTEEELEDALQIVQRMEPSGVGATDLEECLRLQLDALGETGSLAERIVAYHLDDLGANRLPKIAKALGVTLDDVKNAINVIRGLNPQPTLEYAPQGGRHVTPDVIAELDENDEWDIRLASGAEPEISDLFLALYDTTKRGQQLREQMLSDPESGEGFRQLLETAKNQEQGKRMRENYNSARWLVTAVQQRERTLLRVSKEIVEAQSAFLSMQANAPAPLMMQEIAEKVGIDISTVSRAVREKYLESPRGLLPLRMFFTRAVGGQTGTEQSNVHIMNRIQAMIDNEDKKKPLKDDQIQAMLLQEGIDIKRRTVAKYRTNLGFPSHTQRREY